MRPKRLLPPWFLAAGLALPAVLASASAGTLYWDGTSTGPDADGGGGNWTVGGTNWDAAATGGADAAWTDGSTAVFRGTGGNVNAGTVSAATLIFQSPGYSVNGSISFSGAAGLIDTGANNVTLGMSLGSTGWISKKGSGKLQISNVSTGFTGAFSILEGTVRSGGGSIGSLVHVSDGATLEASSGFSGRISIEGAGVGGVGAIFHPGSTGLVIGKLNLTGPATIGGIGPMEIGYSAETASTIDLESYPLTLIGSGEVRFRKRIGSPGNIDVKAGSLWLDNPGMNQPGSAAQVMTIRSGLQFRQSTGSSYTHPWTAVFEPGTTWRVTDSSRWDGPVTLQGALTLNAGSSITHHGIISGAGSITKTGSGIWTVNSISSFAGGTAVSAGRLVLAASNTTTGAGSLDGSVTLANNTFLDITKAGALGTAPGNRVSPLSATGATVELKTTGAEVFDAVNLTRTTLRSNGGVASTDATGYFVFGPTAALNVLAADTPSLVTGRLDLGTGALPASLVVEDGNAAEDLRLQAAITQITPGRGLVKSGAGIVALNAPATHTGSTVIQQGSVRLGALGSFESSPVTVQAGGGFGTGIPGKTFAPLTVGNGGTLILPAAPDSTTTVQGTLHLAGGNVLIAPVLGGDTTPGTYDLATATAVTGSGTPVVDFSAAFGPSRATGSVVVNGNKLQLVLTSAGGNLVWNNASAAGLPDGTWDTTLANFSLGGNNTAFQTYDSVTFGDSVAPGSAKTVTLAGVLVPALVTVDNSNGNYTFTGTENLTGGGSLLKTGTGTLTIGGTGAYPLTGDITAAGGTLDFSGKSLLIDKLTLDGGAFNNATATFSSAEFRSGSATAVLSGSAPWTKTTPGTATLSADSLLTGPGTVAEGILVAGSLTSSTGTPGPGPVHIAAGAALDFRRAGSAIIPNTFSGGGTVIFTGNNISNSFEGYPPSSFNSTVANPGFSGSFHLINSKFVPTPAVLGSAGVTLSGNSYLDLRSLVSSNPVVFPNPVVFANTAPAVSNLVLDAATVTGPVTLSATGTARIRTVFAGGTVSGPIGNSGAPGGLSIEGAYPSSPTFSTSNRLTLSGNSTYTGATTITAEGVLGLTGSLGATAVTVTGTGTLGGSGSIGAGGSLTFQQDGRLWVKPTEAGLTVNGNVDLGTRTRVFVDFFSTPPRGPFPVLNYTGTLTGGAPELVVDTSSPVRQSVFAFPPGGITLDIGSKSLVWKGQSHDKWQPGTAANWNTDGTGETDTYYDGDSVTFDDTGFAKTINGSGNAVVRPAATVFDNSVNNYVVNLRIVGQGSITKRGTGWVSLGYPAVHSGGTVIEQGSFYSTSLGSGPVSVAAGATLVGLQTASGGFTCAGTLNLADVGTVSTGSLTTGPAAFSGIYQCLLGNSASDTLVVNGDVDLTGSTLELSKSVSNSTPVQTYTILTYTGNLTGTFATVTGMPEDYKLVHDVAGKRFIVTRKPFSEWIGLFPGLADLSPQADPDSDGFPNITEWVLGGDPGTADISIIPTHELTTDYFIFNYKRRDSSIFDTTQIVQWSTDMVTWKDVTVGPFSGSGGGGGTVSVTSNGGLPDDIKVYINRPSGQRIFARLKVTPK